MIYSTLDQLQIPYVKHEHPPFYTCEEADAFYEGVEGGHSKNLFLRDRKGKQHYLVVLESHKRLDVKAFGDSLGEKLSFASPERLERYLGLKPGSVSPFGLINDKDKHVKVFIDEELMQHDTLHYHPNINTATLAIAKADFIKFLEWTGNEVTYIPHCHE